MINEVINSKNEVINETKNSPTTFLYADNGFVLNSTIRNGKESGEVNGEDGKVNVRIIEIKKLPDYISVIGESMLDIKPYFNVIPIIHTAFGGERIYIFFRIINRQRKFGKLKSWLA